MTGAAQVVNPREHDQAEAKLFEDLEKAQRDLHSHIDTMHRMAGDKQDRANRRGLWRMTNAQVLEQLRLAVRNGDARDLTYRMTPSDAITAERELRTSVARIELLINGAEAIYRQHRWSRYFPCLNSDGHIHSSLRGCPTVRWDTAMGWTPQLSGKSVEEAVADRGPTLCSLCFPAAPLEWCQKKSDVERAARQAAKAERQAAGYAKRLLPEEAFRVEDGIFGERIETVAACKDVLRREVEFRDYYGHGEHSSHAAYAEAAEQATRVLLGRENRRPGTGATQAEIDKIIANAITKNRKDGARI
jgi:hypothetical protein